MKRKWKALTPQAPQVRSNQGRPCEQGQTTASGCIPDSGRGVGGAAPPKSPPQQPQQTQQPPQVQQPSQTQAPVPGKVAPVVPGRRRPPVKPPPDQSALLAKVGREAQERDLNDAMRELGGVELGTRLGGKLPRDIAAQFDAHGTGTLASLTQLLNGGIDPKREFFSSPLSGAYAEAGGYGTTVRDNSSFVVLSDPGVSLKAGGIAAVLVDPLHEPSIPELHRAFPGVRFLGVNEAPQLLARAAGKYRGGINYGKALAGNVFGIDSPPLDRPHPPQESPLQERRDLAPRLGAKALMDGMKAHCEGVWRTLGAHASGTTEEGEDAGKHGGTPVCIENGRITEGPAALRGKNPEELSDNRGGGRQPKPPRVNPGNRPPVRRHSAVENDLVRGRPISAEERAAYPDIDAKLTQAEEGETKAPAATAPRDHAPSNLQEAQAFGGELRSALEAVMGPAGSEAWCTDVALALKAVYPEAKLWDGHMVDSNGKERFHTVTQVGDFYYDVSGDQYGREKVIVGGKLDPSRYAGMEEIPWDSYQSQEGQTERLTAELRRRGFGGVTPPETAPEAEHPELGKRLKPTKARVNVSPGSPTADEAQINALFEQFTGLKDYKLAAALTGAPDDATANVGAYHNHIEVGVGHHEYTALRKFGRDGEGRPYVENSYFGLEDDAPKGAGIGTKIFCDQVNNAAAAGLAYIKTYAAGHGAKVRSFASEYNGYYTWPRLGYDGPLANITSVRTRRLTQERFPEAITIQDVMATKEGREWWKDNGESIDLEFDLTAGSKSLRILEDYLREKAALAGKKSMTPQVPKVGTGEEDEERGEMPDLSPEDEAALDAAEARREQAGARGEKAIPCNGVWRQIGAHAAAASSGSSGGSPSGSSGSSTPKRHGGVPVCIENGRISKGPARLRGLKPDEIPPDRGTGFQPKIPTVRNREVVPGSKEVADAEKARRNRLGPGLAADEPYEVESVSLAFPEDAEAEARHAVSIYANSANKLADEGANGSRIREWLQWAPEGIRQRVVDRLNPRARLAAGGENPPPAAAHEGRTAKTPEQSHQSEQLEGDSPVRRPPARPDGRGRADPVADARRRLDNQRAARDQVAKDAQAPPSPAPTPEKEALRRAAVAGVRKLGGGRNASEIATFSDGSMGVFKAAGGENLNLLARGNGRYYAREAATYDVAEALGLGDLVPLTVVRNVDGRLGSCQKFVPDAVSAGEIDDDDAAFDGDEDLARAAAFDYLTGNTDRHGGNWMVSAGGKLVLIDNGLAFPDNNDYRGHAHLLAEAAKRRLNMPAAVAGWDWGKLEPILRGYNFGPDELDTARGRLEDLKKSSGFRELRGATNFRAFRDS